MISTRTTATALDGTADRAGEALSAPPQERRRSPRFNVDLPGRFMRENKQEHPCRLRDVSNGGAGIAAPVEPAIGERIVAYFDHIGGLEGVVAHAFEGGFSIELRVTQHKREKLAAQLASLSSRTHGQPPRRRHERFAVDSKTAALRLAEDITIQVAVLDVSISGASVETEARPPIGSEVVLGKLRARVVRHHADGLGLEFIDIQNPDALRPYFR